MTRPGRARDLAAAATVVASYVAVRSGASVDLDRRAAVRLARPLGARADRAIAAATDLGSVFGLAGLAGALALTGRRRLAADVVGSGLLAWSAAQAAKPLVDRRRPYESDGAHRLVAIPAGSSWPSGHIAVVAAASAALEPVLPRRVARAADACVVAVGASRVYVGVHHLSDVVAGWGIGVLSARAWRRVRHRS